MTDITLVDLVKITVTTTGTGAVTFGVAVPGYRGVEALLNGAVYSYSIQQDAEYEVGTGTYLSIGQQFVRSPIVTSNGGAPLDLQSNTSIAFVATAEDILGQDVLRPLYGDGVPDNSIGIIGQVYTDLLAPVTLYGPKTNLGWGTGVILQGNRGPSGVGVNLLTNVPVPADDNLNIVNESLSFGSATLSLDGASDSGYVVSGTALGISSVSNIGDSPVVSQNATGGLYERSGMNLSDLTLTGKNPIQINDPTQLISDDPTAMRVYHAAKLDRVNIIDTDNTGNIGTSWTKVFDSTIGPGTTAGFDVGLQMVGCDLNVVQNRRFTAFRSFGIYAASAQTFGSQTAFRDLDIVSGGAGSTYVKSYEQHVRHYNLYLEPGGTIGGFFDISTVGAKTFGPNVGGPSLTYISRDCRASSQGLAPYVHRVEERVMVTCRIEGTQTTDFANTPSMFIDSTGTTLTYVALHVPGNGRTKEKYIEEHTFGAVWNGHRTKQGVSPVPGGFLITAENAPSWLYNSLTANFGGLASHYGQRIVIPAGNAGNELPVSPDGLGKGSNPYFSAGKTYEVTILARSSVATGDTLSLQQAGLDGSGTSFGSAYAAQSLTDQFQRLVFYVAGRPSNNQECGFNIKSVTSLGDIEIHALSWVEIAGTYTVPERIGDTYIWTDASHALRTKYAGAGIPTGDTDGTPLPVTAAAQANSTATDVPTLVADFNALLAKLRAAGVMAT